MEEKRRFFKKTDVILVAGALLIALGAGLWYQNKAGRAERNIAVITVDGKEYKRIDLARAEDQIIRLQEDAGVRVSFEVCDHRIRFVDVTCPDHICENTGFVFQEGQSAVCMPNRTSVWIAGGEEVHTAG